MHREMKESIQSSFLRGSIEMIELEKSSIQLNFGQKRDRKLSPWGNKINNTKMSIQKCKHNSSIEKTEKSEQFLQKIIPKNSKFGDSKLAKNFQSLIDPMIIKKSEKVNKQERDDENFVNSFVYLPIKPQKKIKTETKQCQSTHKQFRLTSFRQKMMKTINQGKSIAPKQLQMSFSSTSYRSNAESKIKYSTSISFRRKLKKKNTEQKEKKQKSCQRKGTLSDMYNLLGIDRIRSVGNTKSYDQQNEEFHKKQTPQEQVFLKQKSQDNNWFMPLSHKRYKLKKSQVVCKTVYI